MSTRRFGVMNVRGKQSEKFLTRHIFFEPEIDSEIDAISSALSVRNPDYTLDDYLYNNLGEPLFDVNWEVRTYGDGRVAFAPESDLRVFCEAYANGSSELRSIVDDAIFLSHSGTSFIANPYYDPFENEENYDDEEE